MNNPIYDDFKLADLKNDISEVERLLANYESAKVAKELDEINPRAQTLIVSLRKKYLSVSIATAPKSPENSTPISQAVSSTLYSALGTIKTCLEAELFAEIDRQSRGNEGNDSLAK